jgi:hypothetical protein
MMYPLFSSGGRRDEIVRDIRSLKSRIAELNHALETCNPLKVGSTWWNDRLTQACRAKRQVERLEMLLED